MKCSCPVFKHEAGGVRITYHRGRQQPFTVWKRAAGNTFHVHGFYATLEAVAAKGG